MTTIERIQFVEKVLKLHDIAETAPPLDVIRLASHYENIASATSGMEPIARKCREVIDAAADRLFA